MKVVLYAAVRAQSATWRISVDQTLQTDWKYWQACDPSICLWRVNGLLPFGRAIAMLCELNGKSVSVEAVERKLGLACMKVAPQSANAVVILDLALLDKLSKAMVGRSLLMDEFNSLLAHVFNEDVSDIGLSLAQWAYLNSIIRYEASVRLSHRPLWLGLRTRIEAQCQRCGARGNMLRWSECASCGECCPYCEICLNMGRARYCAPLLCGNLLEAGASAVDKQESVCSALSESLADLQLSAAQSRAADEAVRFLLTEGADDERAIREFLIWAVTGAGKTEMIYPLVAAERDRGGKVLIATPRKDVVLELLPRLKSTFVNQRVVALYGGSAERWESADIIVATTHQLLRYEAAFDLVVLDEIDAFPYQGNPMLAFAARKACKRGAAFVMLSATPPPTLQRAAQSGKLPHVKVPVRYHRHPLPVPAMRGRSRLVPLLRQTLKRGAAAFVFVPQIARLAPELARLRLLLAAYCEPGRIEATSSQDPMREQKVRQFRTGDIRILLTTTILERGVTIAKADVVVLGADSRLFDAAALIQMAGRAGRSTADPCGQVSFLAKQRTRAQASAIRQIRSMNRLARKQGFLL